MHKSGFCVLLLSLFICFSAKAQSPGAAIDVQHYGFTIQLNDKDNSIRGKAEITLKFLKKADSFRIDLVKKNSSGKGMLVSSVIESGEQIQFKQDSDALHIMAVSREGRKRTFTITYQGVPADGLIISKNKFGHRTFFGDNWPNRAHNWLPCVDDPADKATVDFTVTAPDHYQVVANGLKVSETALQGNLKQTHWKESAALPTKVMVIGVADFVVDHTGDVNKIPVYTYVFPENKVVGFNGYAVAKEILGYYMDKIGPYAYEKLANVQSKTIFGGMENASCIFYFENSVGDKGIEELMAHEIAHQWFGDAASEKSFAHLWLSEGFATYMTNVYLENKYGRDTLKQRLEKDRKEVFEFEKQRFTPVVDTAVKDNYMQLLNANSYQKGGWVLHMLRRKLGNELFWKGIRAYYERYDGRNANTEDLQEVMQEAAGQPLEQFFKQWLYTPGHLQLSVKWKYDPNQQVVNLEIAQIQNSLYECTVECLINNEFHQIDIKDRLTTVRVPVAVKATSVTLDPNVNLLGEFEVEMGE
jgi:aminopeptidase N